MRRALLVVAVATVTAVLWLSVYRLVAFTRVVAAELEGAIALAELAPRPQTTIVFDIHGQPAFTFFVEQRIE